VALAVLVAGLVGACSSDDGDDGAATSATTSAPEVAPTATTDRVGPSLPSTTTTVAADPATRAAMDRAAARNLTIDDFPSGWQNLPPAEAEVTVVELCSTVDLDQHLLALHRSDAFSYTIEPGTLAASASVITFDEVAAAEALLADFRDDSFVQCATDQLTRSTDRYTVRGAFSRNETDPDLGEEAVALSGEFVVDPADGTPDHTITAVAVALRRGDTVVTLNSTATNRAYDEDVVRNLLTALDERLGG
jgi:hypothetical protein